MFLPLPPAPPGKCELCDKNTKAGHKPLVVKMFRNTRCQILWSFRKVTNTTTNITSLPILLLKTDFLVGEL